MKYFTKQVIQLMENTRMTYGQAADRVIEYFKNDYENEKDDLWAPQYWNYRWAHEELKDNGLI